MNARRNRPTAAVVIVGFLVLGVLVSLYTGAGGLTTTTTLLCVVVTAIVALACGVWVLAMRDAPRLPRGTAVVLVSLTALAALQAASITWSLSPSVSRTTAAATAALALATGVGWLVGARGGSRVLLLGLGWISVVVLADALWIRSFDFAGRFAFTPRLSDPIGHPNLLGAFSIAAVVIGIYEATSARRRGALLGWGMIGLGAFTLPLTSSRSAEILVITVVIALLLGKIARRLTALTIVVVITTATIAGAVWSESPTFSGRFFAHTDAGPWLLGTGIGAIGLAVALGALESRFRNENQRGEKLVPRFTTRSAGLLAVVTVGAYVALVTVVTGLVIHRSVGAQSAGGAQTGIRLTLTSNHRDHWWNVAWSAFDAKQVTGWGAGTYRQLEERLGGNAHPTDSSHSLGLDVLAGTGILGGACLLAVLLGITFCWIRGYGVATDRHARNTVLAGGGVVLAVVAQSNLELTWYALPLAVPALAIVGSWLPQRPMPPQSVVPWSKLASALIVALSVTTLVVGSTAAMSAVLVTNLETGGTNSESQTTAKRAAQLDPLSVPALIAAATACAESGDATDAIRYLRQAAALEPLNPSIRAMIQAFADKPRR